MRLGERNKLSVLISLHLLWGLVLWFSISKYGLGVSTDAVQLLFGGLNLASGNGLTSYDGSFLVLWPPLYPMLLGLVRWATGMEMLATATLIQVVAFLIFALSAAVLLHHIFRERFGLAIAATILAQAGTVMVLAFGMVGSDYLHLSLAVLLLALTGRFVESSSRRGLVMLGFVSVLTTMQRYLGVAALATSALVIFLLGKQSFWRRLADAVVLSATALPMAIWLFVTSQLYSRREPISFSENFDWFSRSLLEWFLGAGISRKVMQQYIPALWIILAALVIVVLIAVSWPGRSSIYHSTENEAAKANGRAYLVPLLLYGAIYALALFGSASIAYSNKLGGRFILPLYLPLIVLPVVAADGILRWVRRLGSRAVYILAAAACYAALAALLVVVLRNTYPLVMDSHANGLAGGENAYNNRTWRENPAIRFWRQQEPPGDYVLLTNEPDGVAFNTQHPAQAAPRKTSGPYGTEDLPITGYRAELFGSGTDPYLIWIEPNPYEHYYRPDELGAIAFLDPLLISDEGAVYQLRPRSRR